MKYFYLFVILFNLTAIKNGIAQGGNTAPVKVESFEKVIISPHVEATFTEGNEESVTVLNATVSSEKIHIESKNNVLRVYLEGAKAVTRNEKEKEQGADRKKPLYTGTVLTVVITYKRLEELSVRGGEDILLKSKLNQDSFTLTLYGESNVNINEVNLDKMYTTIYGECELEFKSGTIREQKFTLYGESKVNALAISNKISRSTNYGESNLKLNVSDLLKVTAFGEAKVGYKGNPEIRKGIHIGQLNIYKID